MRLASVITPFDDRSLTLAAQAGVDEVVIRYEGVDALAETCRRVASYGMKVGVVEGLLPIERLKLGTDDGSDIEEMRRLIAEMGDLGISIVCYNFMAGTDWIRTSVDAAQRGGSRSTAFDLSELHTAMIPGRPRFDPAAEPGSRRGDLWARLERFLEVLLPDAEAAGVVLAMHPDDPPLPELLGNERIMHCVDGFRRLLELAPSPSNKIAFCQGTFSEMGVDIPAVIRELGEGIAYVHFRDVVGTADAFVETWQDEGQTDMAAAMRAYRSIGFDGPIRPDHVPQMIGEDDGEPGYTMLGRLFAYGYIRGLLDAT